MRTRTIMAAAWVWVTAGTGISIALPTSELAKGLEAQQNGDHRSAIRLFTAALHDSPSLADAWYRRGISYAKLSHTAASANAAGLVDTALADLSRAIELDSTNAGAYNLRGTLLLGREYAEQAAADFSTALKRNPRFADAVRGRAAALRVLGRTDEALTDLTRLIALTLHDHIAYRERAEMYMAKAMWPEAIADCSMVLELIGSPSSVEAERIRAQALKTRGDCRLQLGEFGKALSDHREAVPALGRDGAAEIARSWASRASVLARLGKPDTAVLLYTTAIEFNPHYMSAYAGRARSNVGLGRYDRALTDCDTVLAYNPESYLDYLLRGQIHDKLGRTDSAAADYRRALETAKKAGEATDSLVKVIRGLLGKR